MTEHVASEAPGFDPASHQPHDPESLAQNFFQSTVALRVFCPDEGAGSRGSCPYRVPVPVPALLLLPQRGEDKGQGALTAKVRCTRAAVL